MKTLNFKVTLLSDVIINQRAATEGNQNTLDFIPGSAFLGVAAGEIYRDKSDESFTLFHSGKVRFGDAHPLVDGKRSLKVPASWYKKKDDKDDTVIFVHHGMPHEGLKENGNPVQVKQYRGDFIVANGEKEVSKVEINKQFAIKSAYDSEKRRSEDAKMYGYESLQAGSEWCFDVMLDNGVDPKLEADLIASLTGKRRIGRSSTAQYGLVEIECIEKIEGIEKNERKFGFSKWNSPETRDTNENVVFVYAESRLIFFDENGQPTFTPTAGQLGFPDGDICWEMSQVRTFQYAPYNNKRGTYDADRMGIEKGSVFCITGKSCSETVKWVGSYLNEGFGKVLINPDFLDYTDNLGKAKFSFAKEKAKSKTTWISTPTVKTDDQPVLTFLNLQKQQKEDQKFIYKKVNAFVNNYADRFKGDSFASQWGTIRSMAMQFKDAQTLKREIYLNDDSYLRHGVAAEKWNERGRIKLLEEFVKCFDQKAYLLSEAIINLAAEMAKKCRRD